MTGRMLRFSPIVLTALAVAACGGKTTTVTVTETVTTTVTTTNERPPETQTLRVYFLRDGKVAPVARQATRAKLLDALSAGPTEEERQLGLTTEVKPGASVNELSRAGLAQVVYTLTQFDPSKPAPYGGSRADFEDQTPAILVESPLPFQEVAAPLRVTGTANTFEATFEYELTDPGGNVISKHFVTATSGSGTRGTFDFTVPFEAPNGLGSLIVFERSAADGSRIHEVEIPLQLKK